MSDQIVCASEQTESGLATFTQRQILSCTSERIFQSVRNECSRCALPFTAKVGHADMTNPDACDIVCRSQGGVRLAVILLVEDEIFIRESAVWMLEDLGHNILSACDVDEAVLHLGSPQHIDALFVDIRLSTVVHGGYDIANQAIKSRPNLRVLYTSGAPINAEMKDFFVEGAHFLQKPYREDQLQNSVEGLFSASF